MTAQKVTHFLNVDLNIRSRVDLEPLLKALGTRVSVLHAERDKRTYWARLEVCPYRGTADLAIRRFCALIQKLPEAERALWDRASTREFNIGVQSGMRSLSFELAVASGTVRAAAEIDAQIALTIYSPKIPVMDGGLVSAKDAPR